MNRPAGLVADVEACQTFCRQLAAKVGASRGDRPAVFILGDLAVSIAQATFESVRLE